MEEIDEIDFDLFVEKRKNPGADLRDDDDDDDDGSFSMDYRQEEQKSKKASRKKKKKQSAILNAAASATVQMVKETAQKMMNPPHPEPEPEPEADAEIDDFFPEGQENDDEVLMVKDGPEEQPEETADEEGPVVVLKRHGKRRFGIVAGAFVLVLALIGVVSLVGVLGRQIYVAATDDSKLREYDTYLSPIVMQDPMPFETPAEADPGMVMKASLWRALTVNGNSYNTYDDLGRTLVPLVDVADACHELFGPESELQPENPEDETFFIYDTEANVFHVAPYSSQSSFAPYTVDSKKAGSTVVLRVGYVAASDEWRSDTSSTVEKPTPIKYMEYVLQAGADGKQYVTAIRSIQEE